MPIRCKLCGIRSEADLQIAVGAGADAVGFISGVTHFSEDALSGDAARDLAAKTPPYVSTVLVTHLEQADAILDLAEHIGVDTIQVHGLVSPDTLAEVFARAGGRRITKAVHVTGTDAIADARAFLNIADALHLDSRTTDRLGGTGEAHDWEISREIVQIAMREAGKPAILSGGLRPSNLAEAISTTEPYAVDVNSGIEDDKGDKRSDLAGEFVSIASAASVDPAAAIPTQKRRSAAESR
jgi:phosphoribosylanthranilate isomerase